MIGVSLPLAGSQGGNGLDALHAVLLAVEQMPPGSRLSIALDVRDTARGGYANPHEDEGHDTSFDAGSAAADIRAFVAEPHLLGVIGPMTSDMARVEIPIARRAGLALISGSASATDLAGSRSTFFRVCPPDQTYALAAADAVTALGFRLPAVLDDAGAHGRTLAAAFVRAFNRNGGSIAARAHVGAGADATAVLRAVRDARPDVVVYAAGPAVNVLLLRPGALDALLDPRRRALLDDWGILAPNATAYYRLAESGIPASADAAGFARAYRARFHAPPTRLGFDYFTAARLLVGAIRNAADKAANTAPARSAVLNELRATRRFLLDGDPRESLVSVLSVRSSSVSEVRRFEIVDEAQSRP